MAGVLGFAHHGIRATGARTEEQRLRDLGKIEAYRQLEDKIRSQAASSSYGPALFQLTAELLRLNPEYYTIWNVRRRCLISSLLAKPADQQEPTAQEQESDVNVLKSELDFTIPLLMGFPKCYWIWDFRQWVLSQAILRLTAPVASEIWETELGLTSAMLNKDQRNFHAWGYRRIVVARLESPQLRGTSLAEDEFAYTTRMIRRNLSNFSAWHNRSQIIPRLLDERGASDKMRAAFLSEELNFVRGGLNLSPEDQSLWYYHQFLISQIVDSCEPQTITRFMNPREKVVYLRHEIDEIKDLLEDYDNIKWIYEALLEYKLVLMGLENTGRGAGESGDVRTWLAKLRDLDPLRAGRWNDVERQINLSSS
ncbi:hypothetical protein AK830_g1619 [Neonectria ditissima]|uniref:Geranylgeranyl transferase type-2 subunit alpha n=1 Tax=Neonectria ditissima TaxID=78410 RepID=A0A0P7BTX0_9HYPO|nr:hypothetical protein AK830_g1619 [Neonectria ditissima]